MKRNVDLVLLVLIVLGATGVAAARDAQPDIFLVIWDAARPDHMTPYGYERETTTNLQSIADQAVVFDKAFAVAPWTLPSIAGIFTGLFVHNHDVSFDPRAARNGLSDALETLAEALARVGYATAIFASQEIYFDEQGFLQGFQEHATVHGDKVVPRALAFADKSGAKPLFVVLHWLNPHAPYEPLPEHDLWSNPDIAVNVYSGSGKRRPGYIGHDEIRRAEAVLRNEEWAQLEALYDGELRQNDAFLGEFWAELSKRGRAETSVLVFTADHGEGFNEHARQRVWHDLPYDTILHVPLIIRFPSGAPHGRVGSEVRTIDIYPTLLDLAGAAPLHPINGESLIATTAGPIADRPLVGASYFGGGVIFSRSNGVKFFYSRRGTENAELYDLRKDPREERNLGRGHPELIASERDRLHRLLKKTEVVVPREEAAPIDSGTRERLRALGYGDP